MALIIEQHHQPHAINSWLTIFIDIMHAAAFNVNKIFSKIFKTELVWESVLAISKKNGPNESLVNGAHKSKSFNGLVSAEKNNFSHYHFIIVFSLKPDSVSRAREKFSGLCSWSRREIPSLENLSPIVLDQLDDCELMFDATSFGKWLIMMSSLSQWLS